ncbi:MAG: hypothetical protein ACPGJS_16980, partial [Flammeovirgaceae bacterium]
MNNKLNNILLITIILILMNGKLIGQASNQDTVLVGLTYKEQVHIDSLCQLASQIRFTSPDSAMDMADHALNLARKYNYDEGQAKALISLGEVYWLKSGYIRAFDYYFQALQIREQQGKRNASAKLLAQIGLM